MISSMCLSCSRQILTLVLPALLTSVAMAAPSSPAPEKALRPKVSRPSPNEVQVQPQNADSISPSSLDLPELQTLPETSISLPATRIIRPLSLLVSLGMLTGPVEDKEITNLPLLSFAQLRDLGRETAQSYGLSLTGGQIWGLHWENRTYCCLGEKAEPYWSLGFGSFYRSSEQLASLVNIERYHLRVGAGFEDLLGLQRRLRSEAILRLSPLGLTGEINVGWTWDAGE